jgi:hypothetical protein
MRRVSLRERGERQHGDGQRGSETRNETGRRMHEILQESGFMFARANLAAMIRRVSPPPPLR